MISPNNQKNLQNNQPVRLSNAFFIRGGREGAMNYPVQAGYEAFLVDEENKMFFVKYNNPTGQGVILREFTYEEVTPQQTTAIGTPSVFDTSKYATKEDLNAILVEIRKLQEGKDRGRQYNGRNRRSRNGSKPYDESI